jgi:cytochrome oxidase Cu insertion factor (SCO1/SenC/PrrC family)
MNRAIVFWLAVLLVFSGGMLIWAFRQSQLTRGTADIEVQHEDAGVVEPAGPLLTEFELTDQLGKRFSSKSLQGEVWAGSFFFAACPSTCYQQNMKIAELQSKYADQGLKLVSITCDPGNDTPVALASYASRFNADPNVWKFLTVLDGDMLYLTRIGREMFQIMVSGQTHSDRVVLFDREGKMHGSYRVLLIDEKAALDKAVAELLQTPKPELPEGDREDVPQAEDAATSVNVPTDNTPTEGQGAARSLAFPAAVPIASATP